MVGAAGMLPAVAILVLASVIPAQAQNQTQIQNQTQTQTQTQIQTPAKVQARTPAKAPAVLKGTLAGRVTDAQTLEPLPFANVVAFRTTPEDTLGTAAAGGTTGPDGTFALKVPPGTYRVVFSYVTYESTDRRGISVGAGRIVPLDATLRTGATQLETFKVEATVIRSAEGSMIASLRKGSTVADAITSQEMSRTTDGNAAEAMQRVTGVSVVDGRYVFVRGLGERYSATNVNGAGVGSPEPNKRVVPLDIFPTGVIDNMVVQKTYSPDMDGDFGGSVINISTRDFAPGHSLRQSLSIGSSEGTTGDAFMTYDGGKYDFLGIDDGTRSLPDLVGKLGKDRRISTQNFSTQELAEMGQSFNNTWTPRRKEAAPNYGYAGVLSRGARLFGRELGILASASLSNSRRNVDRADNAYLGGADAPPLYQYEVKESTTSVLGGLTGNVAYKLSETDKVKLNLLYTRSSNDKTRLSEGPNSDRGSTLRVTQLSFVEQWLFSGVLQGSHDLGFYGSRMDWNAGYSEASRHEPDRRTSVYEQRDADQPFQLGGSSNYPLTRIFGLSHDTDRSQRLDWTVPLNGEPDGAAKAKVGVAHRTKDRGSDFRRFGYRKIGREKVDLTLSPEDILSDSNLDKGVYRFEELTQANDAYTADQSIHAAYFLVDVPIASRIRLVTGARYESAVQHVDAASRFVSVSSPPIVVEQRDHGWLPSMSLAVKPHIDMNLRFAYSQTLNRPELRELSPFSMYNFESGYSETGDTALVTARLNNYDVRWEVFPAPGEFFALAGFYKRFDHPIQQFVFPTTGTYELRPLNGDRADLYGWEAECRVSAVNLWKAIDWALDLGEVPAAMLRWSVMANYSRVTSEVRLDSVSGTRVKIPFTGQSPYATNLGLFYASKHGKLESGLLYKTFGRRLDAYGSNVLGNIYEYPPRSLDCTLSYGISRSSRIKFSVENLLDSPTEFRQSGFITQRYNEGTTVGLSVSYQPAEAEEE
jgi:TonB-dependent receptor